METRALVVTELNTVTCLPITLPEPAPGEVLIRVTHSAISPGTELRKMTGVEGDGFPYIPGYASVGIVEAAGAGVSLPLGTVVAGAGSKNASVKTMWGAHSAHVVRPADSVVPVPAGINSAEAAVAKLAAIAYHGVKMARPVSDETVLVIGLGAIGQCSARLFAASGCRVIAVARSEERARIAASAEGIEALIVTEDMEQAVKKLIPNGADIVVDCTGVPAVLNDAIACGKMPTWGIEPHFGMRLVVQSSYPDTFAIPYTPAFIREAQILLPRETGRQDVVSVLDLMARGKLDLAPIVSAVRKPEDAQATYDQLRQERGAFLTAVFDWQEG